MARLRVILSLDQFLDGIISLFLTRISPRVTFDHFCSSRHFAAGALPRFLRRRPIQVAYAASSASGAGAALTFFGRGPIVGLALSARISVMRSTVISSR